MKKNQALFSSKDKSKKLKCCVLQLLFGTLRVKNTSSINLAKKNNQQYSRRLYMSRNSE